MKKLFLLAAMTAFIGAGYSAPIASISKTVVVSCDKCDHKCDENCKKDCKKAHKNCKKGEKCCAAKSAATGSGTQSTPQGGAKKSCCAKSAHAKCDKNKTTAKTTCGAKKAEADSQVK